MHPLRPRRRLFATRTITVPKGEDKMAIAPTRHVGTAMGYRVAARIAGYWMVTGPTFDSREEASAHMEGVRAPFKRVVAITIRRRRHERVSVLTLDPNRLAFVRFLVDTRRLDELVAG